MIQCKEVKERRPNRKGGMEGVGVKGGRRGVRERRIKTESGRTGFVVRVDRRLWVDGRWWGHERREGDGCKGVGNGGERIEEYGRLEKGTVDKGRGRKNTGERGR